MSSSKKPNEGVAPSRESELLAFAQDQERRQEMVEAITTLIANMGEDPAREGLVETPNRVVRALQELLQGYGKNAEEILGTIFTDVTSTSNYDQMVVLRNIPYFSMCEHHMLTFSGVAHIAYIPGDKGMVGISKLARLVDMHAQRMQIQEKMTADIANDIEKYLEPVGCAVLMTGQHLCMQSRGVRKIGAEMVTHAVRGALAEGHAKSEFLTLIKI